MSSSTTSLNNDPTSPYYIHPSDFPNHMYVNEALSDGNYGNWVQEMENFLFAKNKIGFVDGTIKQPEEATELMAWRRCDAMVKGWITTALAKEIRNGVRYAKTATEIWKDLQERFKKESAPRAYELKRTLTLTRQENSSVSTYFTKLRSLWDEIDSVSPTPNCSCGASKKIMEAKENERLYEFLMGLDESFSTVKTQILSTKSIVSLGTAYHLVAEDEQQRSIAISRKPNFEVTAFQAGGSNCFEKENKKENSKTKKCPKCGRLGHSIESCFELIGYPEWWTERENKRKSESRGYDNRNIGTR